MGTACVYKRDIAFVSFYPLPNLVLQSWRLQSAHFWEKRYTAQTHICFHRKIWILLHYTIQRYRFHENCKLERFSGTKHRLSWLVLSYLFKDDLFCKVRPVTLACGQFWIICYNTTHWNALKLDSNEQNLLIMLPRFQIYLCWHCFGNIEN